MASHVTALQHFKKRNLRSSSAPIQDDRNNFVVESLNLTSNLIEIGCSDGAVGSTNSVSQLGTYIGNTLCEKNGKVLKKIGQNILIPF